MCKGLGDADGAECCKPLAYGFWNLCCFRGAELDLLPHRWTPLLFGLGIAAHFQCTSDLSSQFPVPPGCVLSA